MTHNRKLIPPGGASRDAPPPGAQGRAVKRTLENVLPERVRFEVSGGVSSDVDEPRAVFGIQAVISVRDRLWAGGVHAPRRV